MTYFHPAWTSMHKHHLKHGFLSETSLRKLDGTGGYHPGVDTGCRTLVCSTYEDALEFGPISTSPSIEFTVLEIEGEYERSPLSGTLVPDGTFFLYGEIPAVCVRLAEPLVIPGRDGSSVPTR